MNMKVFTVGSGKGGVGKSPAVKWTAKRWAEMGLKVLIIDLDPQDGNLTFDLIEKWPDGQPSIADVLIKDEPPTNAMHDLCKECFLMGATAALEDAATELARDPMGVTRLGDILSKVEGFDVCIIDTEPGTDALTLSAIMAADYVMSVANPEVKAIKGIDRVVAAANAIKANTRFAANPTYIGTIITCASEASAKWKANMATLRGRDDILGETPMRNGQDADKQLAAAYGDIAEKIWEALK